MDNKDLLKQYVTIGHALPYDQFMKIVNISFLYKSYMRSRNIAAETGDELNLNEKMVITFKDMIENNSSPLFKLKGVGGEYNYYEHSSDACLFNTNTKKMEIIKILYKGNITPLYFYLFDNRFNSNKLTPINNNYEIDLFQYEDVYIVKDEEGAIIFKKDDVDYYRFISKNWYNSTIEGQKVSGSAKTTINSDEITPNFYLGIHLIHESIDNKFKDYAVSVYGKYFQFFKKDEYISGSVSLYSNYSTITVVKNMNGKNIKDNISFNKFKIVYPDLLEYLKTKIDHLI